MALTLIGLTAAAGLPGSPAAVEPLSAAAATIHHLPGPTVVEAADPSIDTDDPALIDAMEEVEDSFTPGETVAARAPEASLTIDGPVASSGNGITVTFDSGNPSPGNVQTVVLAAAARWDTVLSTSPSGPINIAVIWSNLGNSGLLGSAGPNALYASGSLPTGHFYPAALANTLLNTDLNGSSAEITVNLNSTANWYIGTSGTPSSGQVDLYSVVLHEVAHGLGFLGSASSTNASPAGLDSPAFVYDSLVTVGSFGASLLNQGNPNSFLTGSNLYIQTGSAFSSKVYAPGSWQEGSSFSHFDESTYTAGAAGALMTPQLASQEVERTLDGRTLGVMAGMGWPMAARAITPTVTGSSTTTTSATLTWSCSLAQAGVAPDGFRLEAWRNGTTLDGSATVTGSATTATVSSLVPGASYTLKVVPYSRSVDGTPATSSVTLVGAPSAPGMVRLSGSGLSRTLSWSVPDGNPTSYVVQRSTDGTSWTSVGTPASASIGVTLPADGVYQFRVQAVNGYGGGPFGYSIPTGVSAGLIRPVPLDGQIGRLYQAYFLRSPDSSGFGFWQGQRAAGTPLDTVSSSFAGSAEFVNTYGSLDNSAFIDRVYANVFNRAPDPGGRAYWLDRLARGLSRGALMTAFSESAEMVAGTGTAGPTTANEASVYRLYEAFFLRFPDPSGYAYWVAQRNAGVSLTTIASAFAGSAEFVNTYGSLSDNQFVSLVYANVLARTPDSGGSSYWKGRLAAGLDRGALMVGFSESPEFIIATGTLP